MTTVNINIKNCNFSGSGSDSGVDSSNDPGYDNEPSTGITPPRGFSESAITGRPCKVAVWCYDWVNAWLQVIGDNPWFISTLVQIALSGFAKAFFDVLKWAIGALLGLVAGILDLVPGDEIPMIAAGAVAGGLLDLGTSYGADKLTESMIGDSTTKFQDNRDTFICQIAKGKDAAESKQNVQAYLISEGYPGPIQWLINSLLNDFYNFIFYTPDWWPGFDDYLTGITEVCCDGYQDGTLIEAGSAKACTSANFILDGLVGVLTAADLYVQNYSRTSYNSLSSTEAAMLSNLQANYLVPTSITSKAWSWPLSQAELARYMYGKLSGSDWLTATGGGTYWELGQLGADLQTAIPICDLRNAATAQAAYELLAAEIDSWLTANVTDTALAGHIRLFAQGLIHPAGAFIGVLFTESADLAGFVGSSDCSECVTGTGCAYTFDINPEWTFTDGFQVGNPFAACANVASHGWVEGYMTVETAAGAYNGGYYTVAGCDHVGKTLAEGDVIKADFSANTSTSRGYILVTFGDGSVAYNGGENGTWGINVTSHIGKVVSNIYLIGEGTTSNTVYFDNLIIDIAG